MSPAITSAVKRISHYPRRDGPLPEGAKWAGRPSRWGNPFTIAMARDFGYGEGFSDAELREWLVGLYREWVAGSEEMWMGQKADAARAKLINGLEELRPATALACSCPLDQPCHVDVIIELLDAT